MLTKILPEYVEHIVRYNKQMESRDFQALHMANTKAKWV